MYWWKCGRFHSFTAFKCQQDFYFCSAITIRWDHIWHHIMRKKFQFKIGFWDHPNACAFYADYSYALWWSDTEWNIFVNMINTKCKSDKCNLHSLCFHCSFPLWPKGKVTYNDNMVVIKWLLNIQWTCMGIKSKGKGEGFPVIWLWEQSFWANRLIIRAPCFEIL